MLPTKRRIFTEAPENDRRLRPGCGAGRAECGGAGTVNQAHRLGPPHRLQGVPADAPYILVAGQVRPSTHIPALESGKALKNQGHLLSGNGVVGTKAAVSITADHAVGRSPGHRAGVILVVWHVGEVGAPDGGGTDQPVQDGNNHPPADGRI